MKNLIFLINCLFSNLSLVGLALSLLLIVSCNKNENTQPLDLVTNADLIDNFEPINSADLKIYEHVENLILNQGKTDLDAMFVHSIGFSMEMTQSQLTMNKVQVLEEKFRDMMYAELLSEVALHDQITADKLTVLFPLVKRFTNLEDRLVFLKSEMEAIKETELSTYQVLLGGYTNSVKKLSNDLNGNSRDCVDNCYDENHMGIEWLHYYSVFCAMPENTCTTGVWNWQGVQYANDQLLAFCHDFCNPPGNPCIGVVCPPGFDCVRGVCVDRCKGVWCIQGFTCVNGDCIEDPFPTDDCSKNPCLPGEHCVGGICLPF